MYCKLLSLQLVKGPPVSLNSTQVYNQNITDLKVVSSQYGLYHVPFRLINQILNFVFQPVPWQGGFKNPYSGIIVWPEPDPVKTKLTLLKVNTKLM